MRDASDTAVAPDDDAGLHQDVNTSMARMSWLIARL